MALTAASIGVLALLGWSINEPVLTSFGPGLPTMKATTAISFILIGGALWLRRRGRVSGARSHAVLLLSALVMAIATLSLGEYATGLDFGIDHLFQEPPTAVTPNPGRMAIITGLLFILSAGAVLLRQHGRARIITQVVLATSASLELLAVTGYLLGAPEFIGATATATGIAVPTLVAFLLITTGIMLVPPPEGLPDILRRPGSAALILRALLPVAIITPILIVWVTYSGLDDGRWSSRLRGGWVAVSLTLVLSTVILWTTDRIRKADDARALALAALHDQKTRLAQEVRAQTTDIAAANVRLTASLNEKEALLREIHHRVKNNLQVTAALLFLQSKHATDDETRALFVESMTRVKSMALVHEKLYGSANLAAIDFASYVSDLTRELSRAYGAQERGIEIATRVPHVLFDLDTSVNCGLILHELVSNCIKHAFAGRTNGHVLVSVEQGQPGMLTLSVKDDGTGMPPTVDIETATTMGLQLVDGMVKQLQGTLAIKRDGGTEIRLTFPHKHGPQEQMNEAPP